MYKILLVDDDESTRRICGKVLGKQGYRIFEANNGVEACRKATSETPDLILLDIMMPRMDGFEALELLKVNPVTASIPVIMLTSRDMNYDITLAVEQGVSGYITKPVTPDDLLDSVRRVLNVATGS